MQEAVEIQTSMIQQRSKKIIKILRNERIQIEATLKQQFQNLFKKLQNSGIEQFLLQKYYQICSSFLRACSKLMLVYFPILEVQSFVELQLQSQLFSRTFQLKNSIFKAWKAMCVKLFVNLGETKNFTQRQKSNFLKLKKGSNAKTPLQNSVVLMEWLLRNFNHPYPSNFQKQQLARQSYLTITQVNNWFINSRERVVKKYINRQKRQPQGKLTNKNNSQLDFI